MAQTRDEDVDELIRGAQQGDKPALDGLFLWIVREMHQIAVGLMKKERVDHTLGPSALLNEAVFRLLDEAKLKKIPDRRYLCAAVARAMRQVLVDHARKHKALKRGGDRGRKSLDEIDEVVAAFNANHFDLIALDDALQQLRKFDDLSSRVVELRYFGGHTNDEIAGILGVSITKVEKEWQAARAWLRGQLGGPSGEH